MALNSWYQSLVSSQVAGTSLTAAAAASAIPPAAKFTLPSNYFDTIGKKLKIRATGRISSVNTTPGTARFDVRFGATVVFDSLAILLDTVATKTNVGWILDIELTCRVIGTAGNLWGAGMWTCEDILGVPAAPPKGVLSAILPWNSPPVAGANFDTTATQQIDLFFTQTAATGSLTVDQYEVIAPN
jgi:hypothetical protein